jgi:hypothetical protein
LKIILKPVFIIAIVAVVMIGTSVIPVHGELLQKQADAVVLVKIFGDEFTFEHPNYQMKNPHIFFADNNGNSIHRYHEDATMELLFNSMNIGIDHQCYVFTDGRSFCTNNDYSMKYFINGKLVSDIRDHVVQNNDRILITFGGETDKQIQEYLSQLNSIEIKSGDRTISSDYINSFKENGGIEEFDAQNITMSTKDGYAKLIIISDTYWNAVILDGNQSTSSFDGYGEYSFDIPCGKTDIISINLQKETTEGFIEIQLVQKDKILNQASTNAQYGIASVAAECIPELSGGCLIATATYGSEMATEVQQLRELRDNTLLNTESGTAFMGTFNDIYYSFSPIIADYERENPYFKEAVKLAITPMISTLSLMENAESESEVLGIGISVIMLNIGMYLGVPAIVVIGIRKRI